MTDHSSASYFSDDDNLSSLNESHSDLSSLHLDSSIKQKSEEDKPPWWLKNSAKEMKNVAAKKPVKSWLKKKASQSENALPKFSEKPNVPESTDGATRPKESSNTSDFAGGSLPQPDSLEQITAPCRIEEEDSQPTSTLSEVHSYSAEFENSSSHPVPMSDKSESILSSSDDKSSNVSSLVTDQSEDDLHLDHNIELLKQDELEAKITSAQASLDSNAKKNETGLNPSSNSAIESAPSALSLLPESNLSVKLIAKSSETMAVKSEIPSKGKHVTFTDEIGLSLHMHKPSSTDDSSSIIVKPRKPATSRIAANFCANKNPGQNLQSVDFENLKSEIEKQTKLINAYELENKQLYSENKDKNAKFKRKLEQVEQEKSLQQQQTIHLKELLDQEKLKIEYMQQKSDADASTRFQLKEKIERLELQAVKQKGEFENKLEILRHENISKSDKLDHLQDQLNCANNGHAQSRVIKEAMSVKLKLKKLKSARILSDAKTPIHTERAQQIKDLELKLGCLEEALSFFNPKDNADAIPSSFVDKDTMEDSMQNQINELQNRLDEKEEESKKVIDSFKLEVDEMKKQYNDHRDILQEQVKNLKKKLENLKSREASPKRATLTSLSRECHNKDQQVIELKGRIVDLEKLLADEKALKYGPKSSMAKEKLQSSLPKEIAKLKLEIEFLKKENHQMTTALMENKKGYEQKYQELQSKTVDYKKFESLQQTLHSIEIKHNDEITRMKLDYAQRHAASKVAKLQADVDDQSSKINHLKRCLEKEKEHSKDLAETHIMNLWQMFLETAGQSMGGDLKPPLNQEMAKHSLNDFQDKKNDFQKDHPCHYFNSNKFLHLIQQQYYNKHNQILHFRDRLDEYLHMLEELHLQEISNLSSK